MKSTRFWGSVLLVLLPACSDDNGTKPPPRDSTPPAAVQNLGVESTAGGLITLTWTATGDDGTNGWASRYEIRYSSTPLTEARWDSALSLGSPPATKPAGQLERFARSQPPDGVWHFGLKAADEVPNWSALSNIASASFVDSTPPGPVADLAVVFSTASTVALRWTAPGDDGVVGKASAYDLRYALASITEVTWGDAIQAQGLPTPNIAGSQESVSVTGLERGRTYFFALKTADEVPTWSELSNVASGTTESLRRLTSSSRMAGALRPVWSPSGDRIAFDADWEEQFRFQIYLVSAAGGDPVRLTNLPEGATGAAWSPDGTRLAFVSYRADDPYTLAELSLIDALPGAGPTLLASHGRNLVGRPTWSPDGSHIAYTVTTSAPPTVAEIYVVALAGGSPETIYMESARISAPAWSPDGTRIAFTSSRSGNSDIWVLPASGGEPVQLTSDPLFDATPAWSPDGSRIAFSSNRAGSADIWVMSTSGENPTPLTFDPGGEVSPSWSPDGRQICFSAGNGITDIWVLSLK